MGVPLTRPSVGMHGTISEDTNIQLEHLQRQVYQFFDSRADEGRTRLLGVGEVLCRGLT